MKLHKTYPVAAFKALPDEDGQTGLFEAIVSVFGNVDLQGDKVMEGAFGKDIQRWQKAGDPIPVIWSHEWGDPFAHIGKIHPLDVREIKAKNGNPGGLYVRGSFDVDKPFAKQVYDLLSERRVKEWSFAYDVHDERIGKDGENQLHELEIIEVGPTLKGANPSTVTLGVKSQLEHAAKTQHTAEVVATVAKLGVQVDDQELIELLSVADTLDPELGKSLARGIAPAPDPDPAAGETEPGRKYFYGAPEGSEEARRDAIARAVQSWADEVYPPDDDGYHTWTCVVGTFPDRVVVSVEQPHEEPEFLEFAYAIGDDGEAELENPEPVDVEVTITPADEADAAEPRAASADPAPAKAATKPWHIVEKDGEYCVVKDDTEEVVACHASREEAEAQLRALYASEDDDDEAADDDPDEKALGAKAGRVIGAKAASALKARLTDAVDSFVSEVNGAASGTADDSADGSASSGIDEVNARIAALTL